MGHNENNIIKINYNYIIHLNTVDLSNNDEIDFPFQKEIISINIFRIL